MCAVALAWVALAIIPMSHSQLSFVLMWTLMSLAMMIPTVLRPMLRIAGGSAMRACSFVVGYLTIWIAMAVPAIILVNAVPWSGLLISLGWIVVGLYQLAPWTQKALRRCRSMQASDPAFQLGIKEGVACASACFPLMVIGVVTIAGMQPVLSLLSMVAIAAFMIWEKSPRVGPVALRASGIAVILVASTVLVLGGAETGHVHKMSAPSSWVE